MHFILNYYKIKTMKKILIIQPKNIEGEFIMNGFAKGLQLNECSVLSKCVDELTLDDVKSFKPDMIFGYDYSFLINDSCKKIIQKSGCKNLVFYFADEPRGEYALEGKTCLYDELKKMKAKVFIWDKDFVDEFKNSIYLPLAINPRKYSTGFSGYKYAITFVGEPLGDVRQKILCDLVKIFKKKLCIFSSKENFLTSIKEIKEKRLLDEDEIEIYSRCWKEPVKKEEELAEIYNSSKINLNISSQGTSSINYRVFEVLASGGFLLTDDRKDLSEYFEISKQLEIFKNVEDLIDKIEFYLNNLNIAQKIAQLGKFEVIENHTFSARAGNLLKNTGF